MLPLVVFHDNCADGYTGAWVAHQFFEGKLELYPGVHGHGNIVLPQFAGRDVYMIDFCYPRAIVEEMIRDARRVTVLDHHITTRDDLAGLTGFDMILDMNRSGSRIAWDYFFRDKPAPEVLLSIEDYDLNRFSLPLTRETNATVFSYPYNLDIWTRLMGSTAEELATEGTSINRKIARDIFHLLPVVTRRMNIAGHEVPVANIPFTMAGDAARILAQGEKFGACYWDGPEYRTFSLRSVEGGIDVAEVAALYGGGGHRDAAGFRVHYDIASSFESVQVKGDPRYAA